MSTSPVTFGNRNWLRFAQLVVSNQSVGIDVSNLRIRFEIHSSDFETPNIAIIRIYNPSPSTANDIWSEATYVNLTVGYSDSSSQGTIFEGNIKQVKLGRDRNVDSYVDIFAADGDEAYNQSVINKTFPAGTSDHQELSEIASVMGIPSAEPNDGFLNTGGILPRGRTLFGMARVFARDLAKKNNCRWSIQNGVLTLIPNTGYLIGNGNAVVLNSNSGLIGTPEATGNGIMARCYINPFITIGQLVQIDQGLINRTNLVGAAGAFFPSYTSQYYPATTTWDGFYRVLAIDHFGDTRGNDWYSELTCLNVDKSAKQGKKVLENG